jgi:hypothetical protein
MLNSKKDLDGAHVLPPVPRETPRCAEYIQSAEGAVSSIMRLLEKGSGRSSASDVHDRQQYPQQLEDASDSLVEQKPANDLETQKNPPRMIRFSSVQ